MTELLLRGVVFDMDGVIIDSHPLHKRAWRDFLMYIGKNVSDSELNFIFEGRRREEILVHFLGELSSSQIEEYGKKKDEFFRQASNDLKPVDGAIEFVKTLTDAELCLGLATSASRQRALWTIQQLDIADCFEVVVTGDDVIRGKPDPALYRLAAEQLAVPPCFLIAIEDSVSGIISANAAGLYCIGVSAGNANLLIQAGADLVVPNLMNLSIQDLEERLKASTGSASLRWPS